VTLLSPNIDAWTKLINHNERPDTEPATVSQINQLLFVEAVFKAVGGVFLVLVPGLTIGFFGLPRSDGNFWPRMLGALLLGLGLASLLQGTLRAQGGLGLTGSIAVNLTVTAVLGSLLILGKTTPTRRGRFTLWCLMIVLTLLSLAELAFAS